MTRRDFLKTSLLVGGTLFFSPGPAIVAQGGGERWEPVYAGLERQGRFVQKVEEADAMFEQCRLFPRECGANRLKGEQGFCRAPGKAVVFSAQPHFGEEVPLVYNTSGCERLEIVKHLEGVVDIYMPDMKYMEAGMGLPQ